MNVKVTYSMVICLLYFEVNALYLGIAVTFRSRQSSNQFLSELAL